MMDMAQKKLGIIIAADILEAAIKAWGPAPFCADIAAVYLAGIDQDKVSLYVQTYFGAKLFYDVSAFYHAVDTGLILNLTSDSELMAELRELCGPAVVDGEIAALLWHFIDNLEKKTLEREIFFQALNSTVEGIEISDDKGLVTFINESMLNMINIDEKERLGKSVYSVSPDGGMARVLEEKKAVKNIRNCPQGSKVQVMSNAGPIFVNGKFYGAVTVANDVTELKQLSKELAEHREMSDMLEKKIGYLASTKYTFDDVAGHNEQMQKVIQVARRVAVGDLNILIQGESGTGKEIFAHAIHNCSNRRLKPFIPVNCAAIPEQLLESEFFGHEKGAFTSAVACKPGLFDLANNGTLFLDEIGEMNLNLQSKLLRVLQDKVYMRVGGTKSVRSDVRIIAATNRNLGLLVSEGRFREDLFYRLSVINIVIPPLRERLDDIGDISSYLLKRIAAREGVYTPQLTHEALLRLSEYSWPGNVRELENVLERAMFLCQGNIIKGRDIHHPEIYVKKGDQEKTEREKIIECLKQYGWSVHGKKEAAKEMNISLATLYNKIKLYKLHNFYAHASQF